MQLCLLLGYWPVRDIDHPLCYLDIRILSNALALIVHVVNSVPTLTQFQVNACRVFIAVDCVLKSVALRMLVCMSDNV